jgi:hypothetical protein
LEVLMDRARIALNAIDLTGRGLEIGPAYDPLVPKSSGARIETIDHAMRDELVAKYADFGLDEDRLNRIEPVDYVWTGGSLLDVIKEQARYDYIVAAHVIEHTVDLVQFLRDCEVLLTRAGRLALVVPDKRYTFDRFRPVSTAGDVLEAHHADRRFHPLGPLVDHQLYACRRGDALGWGPSDDRQVELQFSDFEGVPEAVRDGLEQRSYRDTHRWLFTPTSFRLLISDLAQLGYHGFGTVASAPTTGFEFFVTLGKDTPTATEDDRRNYLMQIERELAETTVAALQAELASYQDAMPSATQEHASQSEIIANQRATIDHLQTALADLYASTSWTVTRPIRRASTMLRRLRHR